MKIYKIAVRNGNTQYNVGTYNSYNEARIEGLKHKKLIQPLKEGEDVMLYIEHWEKVSTTPYIL